MSERIDNFRESAIETMHHCSAWDGVVEIFDLTGRTRAKRCYAWSYLENGEQQYTTVLEIPPVVPMGDWKERRLRWLVAANI